jgi:hypothetical protein
MAIFPAQAPASRYIYATRAKSHLPVSLSEALPPNKERMQSPRPCKTGCGCTFSLYLLEAAETQFCFDQGPKKKIWIAPPEKKDRESQCYATHHDSWYEACGPTQKLQQNKRLEE